MNMRTILSAAVLVVMAAVTPARADVIYTLDNVQFSDGGGANGFFTINVAGFVSNYSVVTTGGSVLGGATYATGMGQPSTSNDAAKDTLTFNLAGYNGFLSLTFANALFPTSGTNNPIVVGSGSYECNSYQQLDGSCRGALRGVTTGSATVPEPISLAIFGAGLVGLAIARRRKAPAHV